MTHEVPHLSRSMQGRVVFITGAASGIGEACAHVFAREGARVALSDIDGAGAEAVAEAIRAEQGDARAWTLDVTDPKAIVTVIGQAAAHFGALDCLVNNAGAAQAYRSSTRPISTRSGTGSSMSC